MIPRITTVSEAPGQDSVQLVRANNSNFTVGYGILLDLMVIEWKLNTMWGPQDSKVGANNITMVYGIYNELVTGCYWGFC